MTPCSKYAVIMFSLCSMSRTSQIASNLFLSFPTSHFPKVRKRCSCCVSCVDPSQKNIMEYTKVAKEEENKLRQQHCTFGFPFSLVSDDVKYRKSMLPKMLEILNQMRETAAAREARPSDSEKADSVESDGEGEEVDKLVQADDFFVEEEKWRVFGNKHSKDCISWDHEGTWRCSGCWRVRGRASPHAPDRFRSPHAGRLRARRTGGSCAATRGRCRRPWLAPRGARGRGFAGRRRRSPRRE